MDWPMLMPTPAKLDAFNLYAALMREAQHRLYTLERVAKGETNLTAMFVRDFCFLELRLVCELIALGCLAAHGDIKETTSLKGHYAADRIVNKLAALHKNFYPTPIIIKNKNEKGFSSFPKAETFSMKELVALDRRCGELTHRGSLEKLIASKTASQTDPNIHVREALDWLKKIWEQLQYHRVSLIDEKTSFVFSMAQGESVGGIAIRK